MKVVAADGWLMVPYLGHDIAQVEIGVGDPVEWKHAFLDYYDDQRVAKIRPPADMMTQTNVRLRVDGVVTYTQLFVV